MEIWKEIHGYEGLYQINQNGIVKNMRGDRIMECSVNQRGYLKVSLTKNRERKSKFVHRLVAETFIPNPHNYPQVNHKDENKKNNNISNLEWCTNKYNNNYGSMHRIRSQNTKRRWASGELNGDMINKKKREAIPVGRNAEICDLYKQGMTQHQIAKRYNVTQACIWLILHKKAIE